MTSQALRPHVSLLRHGLWLLLAGAAIVLAAFIDVRILGVSPIAEGPPRFDAIFLLRTALAALASLLFVASFASARNGGEAHRLTSPRGPSRAGDRPCGRVVALVALVMSVSFVALFIADAGLFFELGSEDGLIETMSVILLVAGAASFAATSFRLRAKAGGWRKPAVMASLLFALLLFLIAMEELSWGQRIFSLRTPEAFGTNLQHELNFHNFATNKSESVYYFGTFAFLVALPFVLRFTGLFGHRRFLPMFVPSRLVMTLGALPVAFNYDMWNIVATQFAFFTTLLILAHEAWADRHVRGADALLAAGVWLVCVVTQLVFVALGEHSVRSWDVTEYKELLIPMVLALYAAQVLERAKRAA